MSLSPTRLRLLLNDGFGSIEDREFILRTLNKVNKKPISSLNLRERTVVIELFKQLIPVILDDTVILNKFRNFGKKNLINIKERTP